ncbi:hypothetical protein F5B20DRAFT_537799 [Whalleya microplaca]|nr:hypothetical protein F5B20DRAFT_537799 [Whalleya microplaca]
MSYSGTLDQEKLEALHHGNRIALPIGVAVVCMVSATMVVLLRIHTRHKILGQLWLDDYMAIAGLIGTITSGIISCVHTKYGLGYHFWDLKTMNTTDFWKLLYLGTIVYNITLLCIKFSLFFQYYRLIQEVSYYRLTYIAIMALVSAWVLAQIFVLIFQCSPIESTWDASLENRKCVNTTKVALINAVGNIVTDIIVLLLPMPVVWRLNLKRGHKWAIMGVFTLGFLTCIISACRLIYYTRIGADFSWDSAPVAAWAMAELASGLICASLINLRPLFRRCFPKSHVSKPDSNSPKLYTFGGLDRYLRRNSSRVRQKQGEMSGMPFDGSETELTRVDPGIRKLQKAEIRTSSIHGQGSVHSAAGSKLELRQDADDLEAMPDHRLGLETGIRTVITTGDRDSIHSCSPPLSPAGIVVKQVWSVHKKVSTEQGPKGSADQ